MDRKGTIERKTKETDISLQLNLDGAGKAAIETGIPFLDHMLSLLAAHGFFDLEIQAKGDIEVDDHHTVEDLGIAMGRGLRKALGEKRGIRRYGEATVPMDEALARVVLDISNRPVLSYRVSLQNRITGSFDVGLLREFFRALVTHAGVTMHVDLLTGDEPHHVSEAVFKAFARALDQATCTDSRLGQGVPSTKGLL
jgi:imidazoleglycerol-phosphate dehydratase